MGASVPNWGLHGAARLPMISSVKALHSCCSGPSCTKPPCAYTIGFEKLAPTRNHQYPDGERLQSR